MNLSEALTLAVRHHQAGRLDAAEALYRLVLQALPAQPDALHLLGVVAHQRGDHDTAIGLIQQAIRANGAAADFHINLSSAYVAAGQLPEAVESYQRALALEDARPDAHKGLAEALRRLGALDEALRHAQRAVSLGPTVETLRGLGDIHYDRTEHDEAAAAFGRALTLNPNDALTHNNLGNTHKLRCDLGAAEAHYRRALELDPNLAVAWTNLGVVLCEQGRAGEAVAAHRRAVRLVPGSSIALNALGVAVRETGQPDEAAEWFEEALAVDPHRMEAWNNLALARLDQGRVADAVACCERALQAWPHFIDAHDTLLFARIFLPGDDGTALAAAQRRWGERHADHLGAVVAPHPNDRAPGRRLRVGYVSPYFREHCQAFFTVPLLASHDHQQVEVYCYSDVKVSDAITERLRPYADVWRDVRSLSDEELAARIRADRIDVLVDLTMHLAGNRALVFARRPTPVQVCWLAYPGSTGMAAMDYRISDALLDPPGEHDHLYVERTIYLPDAFWCYDPLEHATTVGPPPAARDGHVTFGCLNNFCKVNPFVLELWAWVLTSVPDSRLLLLAPEGTHRQETLERLRAGGVAPERVTFVARRPRAQYLELYREIDIALDTVPSNGHTTGLDGLWMGVPAVTLVGPTVTGRAGLCQLTQLGLTGLIAHGADDYVRIATELATDRPRLAALRASLRARLQASPLMDAPRFARNMEAAYRRMWTDWCASVAERPGPAADRPAPASAIPRRIHQLWKDEDLPPRYTAFADTWKRLHPAWEYTLWTDEMLRALIAARAPGLLAIYDGYVNSISRADLGRYVVLREYGGVYADLDCECLRPIEPLLPAGSGFALADEPGAHARTALAARRDLRALPCPSFLASQPGHPAWDAVFDAIRASANLPDPLDATGPFLLARALAHPAIAPQVDRLPTERIYPFTRDECWTGQVHDLELWERRTREAYVLHYWDGTWFDHDAANPGLPEDVPVSIDNPDVPPLAWDHAPRVSCVMVTSGRAAPARRAIACFVAQTYPHRELLIVTAQPDRALADHIAALGRPDIRLVVHDRPDATLGALRNHAVEHSEGELICTWDDDDLHDPARLSVQVAALLRTGASACVLPRLALWWPLQQRLAISARRAWEGSLLALKSALPRYAPLARAEDTPVTQHLLAHARVASVDLPRLYVYVAHGGNTSPESQFEHWWDTASARFHGPRYHDVLRELAKRFPAGIGFEPSADDASATNAVVSLRNPHLPPAPVGDPSEEPRVSCLMVTRDRGALAAQAVDCFLAQTYADKELVIVTERLDPTLDAHLARIASTLIRVEIVGDAGLTLGALRNLAVELARGPLVCQWDDDDLYDPERLAQQVAALRRAEAHACLLQRWTIWWPARGRLAVSAPRPWEGSLLAIKASMPRYPSLPRGEDTPVVDQLLRDTRVAMLDLPRLYVYRVHGDNTFPESHFDRHWLAADERYVGPAYAARLNELAARLPAGSVPKPTGAATGACGP